MCHSEDRLTIHITDLTFDKRGMMGSSCGKCLAGAVVPARLFRARAAKCGSRHQWQDYAERRRSAFLRRALGTRKLGYASQNPGTRAWERGTSAGRLVTVLVDDGRGLA